MRWISFLLILTVGVSLLLSSCGGTAAAVTTFTIGGTVYGLSGSGLVLQDNGVDNLAISASGTFTFPTTVVSGANFAVTILSQPANPAQTCTVVNGSGTAAANVSAVQIICATDSFTVGVTVTGLSGSGLVLQNNAANNLQVAANGTYTFSTAITRGSTYNVTVLTQPSAPAQTCGVSNGFGTVTIANATGIQVNCITTTVTYTIGVAVSGLAGTGLVLQNNGGDNLPVGANGNYSFATPIASGATYGVSVLTQPSNPAQTCVVTVGNGTASANVTGIPVTCSNNMANIAVTVSGLLPNTSVVLQDNGGDNLTVSTNGAVTNFNTPLSRDSSYAVLVSQQPAGRTCTAGANSRGTVSGGNVDVAVTCGSIVAAGETHTCALTSAGAVWCWGLNASGQLGNGTRNNSSSPLPVLNAAGNAPLSGVVTIAAGQDHTCAVTNSGGALCWGDNSQGELGNGSTTSSSLPVAVSGLSSGVASISAGPGFTCAVTTTGAAECWGLGVSGQLGNGAAADSLAPAQVSGMSAGVAEIAAGASHACALTDEGAVWCWGLNASGQLGDGTLGSSATPVRVLGAVGNAALSGVVAIVAGQDHTCGTTATEAVTCWGNLNEAAPVSADTTSSTAEAQSNGQSNGVVAIAESDSHSCAVHADGTVWCWGLNADGQLGNGRTVSSSLPVEVVSEWDAGSLHLF
jgi:Regulator of chromosome condensation (RCC1) repeat